MSCYTQKKFIIQGEVKDDIDDGSDIPILRATLALICSQYNLELIEEK